MSTTQEPTTPPPLPSWIATLNRHRRETAYGLFALAVLLILLAAWLFVRHGWDYAPIGCWSGFLGIVAAGGGAWALLGETEELGGLESMRVLVLMVGGLAGLATWVLSVFLAYGWRDTILGGIEAWQGDHGWQLWVCVLVMSVGLVVMFASLLLARSVERFNPLLRRLVYGYNSVLTGVLVLAILMVCNVLVYNYLTASYDWTESAMFSLSDRSKNILKALEKPTRIYVIWPGGGPSEVQTLMDNIRTINDRVQVEYLSPDLQFERVRELTRRYGFDMTSRRGILVVYGSENEADHQFIIGDDLFPRDPDRSSGQRERHLFKGEDALMTALSFLEEQKVRARLYFLQGNGEVDIKDTSGNRAGQGAGALRERLEKANYEVKGLRLVPSAALTADDSLITAATKVPDDASIVIIAGPRTPLPDHALTALRDYLNPTGEGGKRGKLCVLLDLVLDASQSQSLVKTGLEDLLAQLNVQVGNERILSLPTSTLTMRSPLNVAVMTNPQLQDNPVVTAFADSVFGLHDVRPVRPQSGPGTNPRPDLSTEALLIAPGLATPLYQAAVFTEQNLRADATQLVRDLQKEGRSVMLGRLSQEAIPVAVIVSQRVSPPPNPADPHAFMRNQEQRPQAAVFGSVSFLSNAYITDPGSPGYALFSSTLAWLRERPASIGVEPKARNIYLLNPNEDTIKRMKWLPAMLMFIAIVGLGTGVWLVRRR